MNHSTCPPADVAVTNGSGNEHRRAHFTLDHGTSFWVSAGVVAHTLWTSAAPSMTYQLYAAQWHLTQTVTAGVFAVYPIAVVTILILFGDLSDHIGRRATMLLGLGASLMGVLILAVAPSVAWLFLARAFMGIGVGLSAGPSTAALVEFNAGGSSRRASMVATVAQGVGFAAALILGGAFVQYGPWPMHLVFWMLAALLTLLLAATWFLPRHAGPGPVETWRPRLPSVPRRTRKAFVIAAVAMMTAYTHGVMILSLGGQVAHDLVDSRNALVNGTILAVFAITSGVVGILAKPLPARVAMIVGASASAAGMGLLALAAAWHRLPIFMAATAMTGTGYSLLFLSALEVINHATPSSRRGGVLSALYLLAYLSMGVVAAVLGRVATIHGLRFSVDLGVGIIALLSFVTLGLAVAVLRSADLRTLLEEG
ncbi:MFS transporter [Paraburkholderia sp.]|uniref:MFS transporter n=1 Tax=Paraburkholderia sp. TaxID=1926495 RepID=UPI003D6FEB8D